MRSRGVIRGVVGLLGVALSVCVGVDVLAAAPAAATTITITPGACPGGGVSFCFGPESIAIHSGETITWTDQTGIAHQIAPCTPSVCPGAPAGTGGNAFNVFVPPDGSGSFIFTSAGTYTYYCSIHGYDAMHGSITVSADVTPPPSPSPTTRPSARPTPHPTQRPSMKPSGATPKASPRASTSPTSTARVTPATTAVSTPSAVPSVASGPPSTTPAPHGVGVVSAGGPGSPVLPNAIVVAVLLLAAPATWYVIRRLT